MSWLLSLSTRNKLLMGFGLMMILLLTVSFVAYQSVTAIQKSEQLLYHLQFANSMDVKIIRSHQNAIRADLMEAMLRPRQTKEWDALLTDIFQRSNSVKMIMARLLKRNENNPEFLEKLKPFDAIQTHSNTMRETQSLPFLRAGKINEAKALIFGVQATRNQQMQIIADEIVDLAETKASAAMTESKQMAESSVRTFIIMSLIAIILSFTMTMVLTRIMAHPLTILSEAAKRIARGDLTVILPSHHRTDETGVLMQSFSQMVQSLREIMVKINEGITVLASSASEITASTSQVAAGSAETAAAINQTTVTIEEVKQTSDLSVKKAEYVAAIAQKTVETSTNGKKSMDQSIIAMNRIQEQMEFIAQSIIRLSEQSKDIGEIITTVNSLAEQSNLLAVNAAIEAAKAGEQGKGFAVVAQEVKSMAAQSKQATAQVRSILTDIQNATSAAVIATEEGSKVVEEGVVRSGEAGTSIVSLADNIAESAQAAAQIMSSAQQQLVGMDQIALAMQNINQASTQNVASTSQAEIAAKDLHTLGQNLKLLVDQYKI